MKKQSELIKCIILGLIPLIAILILLILVWPSNLNTSKKMTNDLLPEKYRDKTVKINKTFDVSNVLDSTKKDDDTTIKTTQIYFKSENKTESITITESESPHDPTVLNPEKIKTSQKITNISSKDLKMFKNKPIDFTKIKSIEKKPMSMKLQLNSNYSDENSIKLYISN